LSNVLEQGKPNKNPTYKQEPYLLKHEAQPRATHRSHCHSPQPVAIKNSSGVQQGKVPDHRLQNSKPVQEEKKQGLAPRENSDGDQLTGYADNQDE
jgi:hypothetical protein